MVLNLQIKALIVSFIYGIILAYILNLQYKYFFNSKLWYKIVLTGLFVFDNSLLYFLILRFINNGIFHIYFIFLMVIGFIIGNLLMKKRNI